MNKVIRDGNVAVIYSPGYGAGWYTWNTEYGIDLIFNPSLVLAILGESGELPDVVATILFPKAYAGGLSKCEIKWIPQGSRFEITEYDGNEDIRILEPNDGFVA